VDGGALHHWLLVRLVTTAARVLVPVLGGPAKHLDDDGVANRDLKTQQAVPRRHLRW
jgi:hypothetical protein